MKERAIIPEEIIDHDKEIDETPPAVFGSWKRLYWLVFIVLFSSIILFYFLTVSLS